MMNSIFIVILDMDYLIFNYFQHKQMIFNLINNILEIGINIDKEKNYDRKERLKWKK